MLHRDYHFRLPHWQALLSPWHASEYLRTESSCGGACRSAFIKRCQHFIDACLGFGEMLSRFWNMLLHCRIVASSCSSVIECSMVPKHMFHALAFNLDVATLDNWTDRRDRSRPVPAVRVRSRVRTGHDPPTAKARINSSDTWIFPHGSPWLIPSGLPCSLRRPYISRTQILFSPTTPAAIEPQCKPIRTLISGWIPSTMYHHNYRGM